MDVVDAVVDDVVVAVVDVVAAAVKKISFAFPRRFPKSRRDTIISLFSSPKEENLQSSKRSFFSFAEFFISSLFWRFFWPRPSLEMHPVEK